MRADKGHLVAYGLKNRRTRAHELRFEGGEDVPQAVVEWLKNRLTQPQLTICSRLYLDPPFTAFTAELLERGYDLSTLRFSIALRSVQVPLPKRLRRIGERPGVLAARWAHAGEEGGHDLCCSWHKPGRRADMSLFFSLMSTQFYPDLFSKDARGVTVRQELEAFGFDIRTLRFQVKMPLSALAGS
jgi:hypothetical protein